MTEELAEKVARAISASKQGNGNTAAVAAQYVETFWRDYLPEARIAVEVLSASPARPATDETARLRERVAELEAALKPFSHKDYTYQRVSRDGWMASLNAESHIANQLLRASSTLGGETP